MKASLICVGTGMTLGAHISPITKSYIEQARDKSSYAKMDVNTKGTNNC